MGIKMEEDKEKEETYVGWDGKIYPKMNDETFRLLCSKVLGAVETQPLDEKIVILSFCLIFIMMTKKFTIHQAGIVLDNIKENFEHLVLESYQQENGL